MTKRRGARSADPHVIFKYFFSLGWELSCAWLYVVCMVWCACRGGKGGVQGGVLGRQGGGLHAMLLYAMRSRSCVSSLPSRIRWYTQEEGTRGLHLVHPIFDMVGLGWDY